MYEPNDKILKRYADVLVNYALNSGDGLKKGEVVQVIIPDVAKPLLKHLQATILKAGGHMITRFLPTGLDKQFFNLASDDQLTFFPKKYIKSRVDLIDHSIGIIAELDPHELQDVSPKKIFKAQEKRQLARKWLNDKEAAGNFTWTGAMYGTPAMAKEAKLSLEEYWQQIIKACFLDKTDPVNVWRKTQKEMRTFSKKLEDLQIDRLHVEAENIDLWITLGEKRKWLTGGGRNIPSFEIFTSPDWRGTEGYIYFNQPLYRYGNLIKDVRLEFKKGKVVKATASKNQKILREMIAQKDADKVGEFSLTDSRHSRITKFMADTLFDENMGGKFGNTHIALGMSYKDTYDGDIANVTKKELDKLGFNNIYCTVHTDIISTEDRTVTATLKDGSEKVIYKDGKFQV